ncbi:MAG TPA: hypothetical protein VLV87_04225 [Gammaproteobacteria bacterium]|nr:hypothetical protein [Gammaproteobacteria bacterium]
MCLSPQGSPCGLRHLATQGHIFASDSQYPVALLEAGFAVVILTLSSKIQHADADA